MRETISMSPPEKAATLNTSSPALLGPTLLTLGTPSAGQGSAQTRQESLLHAGLGPRAQRPDTRNRCPLLPALRGRGPSFQTREGSWRGESVSKATASTSSNTKPPPPEELWKELNCIISQMVCPRRNKEMSQPCRGGPWGPLASRVPGPFPQSTSETSCQPASSQDPVPPLPLHHHYHQRWPRVLPCPCPRLKGRQRGVRALPLPRPGL